MSIKKREANVLIFGAGPAGISASINASMDGARVILIERYPQVGGMSTLIPISMWPIVTSMEIGEMEQSYNGFPNMVVENLRKLGGIEERTIVADGVDTWMPDDGGSNSRITSKWYFYDPEVLKYLFFTMLSDAGVEVMLNTLAVKPVMDAGRVAGVEVETLLEREFLTGDVIIDTTGSADIVHRAGMPTDYGLSETGMIMPSSTAWRMAGVDTDGLDPDEVVKTYMAKRASGELDVPLDGIAVHAVGRGIVHFFGTRVFNVNPLDPVETARGEKEQRRQIHEISDMLKKELPAFKDARVISTGLSIGMIGTRRIHGDYRISMNELLAAKKFDDVIATGTYRIEIWDPEGSNNYFHHLKNDWYSFPYRCLLPKGLDNVITAGSCISGQYEGMASWAIQPVCMLTGQAAGTAAGICVREGSLPREISVGKLQDELRRKGVFLG